MICWEVILVAHGDDDIQLGIFASTNIKPTAAGDAKSTREWKNACFVHMLMHFHDCNVHCMFYPKIGYRHSQTLSKSAKRMFSRVAFAEQHHCTLEIAGNAVVLPTASRNRFQIRINKHKATVRRCDSANAARFHWTCLNIPPRQLPWGLFSYDHKAL